MSLLVLNNEILSCDKCEDLLHSRIQPVIGCGNIHANIMIIGESPGRKEAEEKIPFVGKSGRLLNNILESFGFKREDIYITNTCHCRPPLNRTPTREEIKNCSGFLTREIDIINPKYIICMGAVASQAVLSTDEKITKLRGKKHKVNNRDVFAMYHPSYLLRNPEAKKDMHDDFSFFVREIKNEKI